MAGGIRDAAGARDPGQDSGWPAAGVLGIVEDLAVSGIDPLALTMVRQAGRVLASDGVRTATVDLSAHDWTRTRREGFLVCEIEAAAFHGEALAADPEGFSPAFRDMLAYGLRQGGPRAALAAHRLAEAAEALAAALDPVDALLLPTVPQASFAHGEPAPANQADLTALANLLGAPAIALPWGGDARGLPLSVQLIGAPGSEQPLLDLAARLERLRPPEATPVAPSFRSPA
jgi:aspartyl-tRNA(Asn)/glutamyl-tRNA(Gln) amidotransferase subunit A